MIQINHNVVIMMYLCSCQYLGVETHKDSVTLTRVAPTKYEQHIAAINACLKSGHGKELSAAQRQAMLQQLQREGKPRAKAPAIALAHDGRICADYSSGTIESEQVRRCRYKLDIYPLAALKNCVQAARADTPKIKSQINSFCQEAKTAAQSLKPAEITERQLEGLCLYQRLNDNDCAQTADDFAACRG